jgi:pimeloyl-ACP methyl ester carboxylesterase
MDGTAFTVTAPEGALIRGLRSDAQPGGATFLWLCGFNSDFTGTKAAHLHAWAVAQGHGFTRFDYFGHGSSDGDFADGTIGRWRDDALAVLDTLPPGPVRLVGSSMGGWIALLVARARPDRVAGMVLIAPAPDFTERLIWANLTPAQRAMIETEGRWLRPSPYGDGPYPITRALIEDGRTHLVLDGPIAFEGPVRILHGEGDDEVPWAGSVTLAQRLTTRDVHLCLVKAGDHRLSSPSDLALLETACAQVV